MWKNAAFLIAFSVFLFTQGCNTHHEVAVAPVEVKPIHITIDVNIKIDKELDDFFNEIDEIEEESEGASSTEE